MFIDHNSSLPLSEPFILEKDGNTHLIINNKNKPCVNHKNGIKEERPCPTHNLYKVYHNFLLEGREGNGIIKIWEK